MGSAIYSKGRVLSGSQAKNSKKAWHKAKLIMRNMFGIEFKDARKHLNDKGFYCAAWPRK